MLKDISTTLTNEYEQYYQNSVLVLVMAWLALAGCKAEPSPTPEPTRPPAPLTTMLPVATPSPEATATLSTREITPTPTIGPLSDISQDLVRRIELAGQAITSEGVGAVYAENVLTFRLGLDVSFVVLTNLDQLAGDLVSVGRSQIRWPVNDFYQPYRVQGYWLDNDGSGGHFGTDIGVRTKMLEKSFPVRAVHPEARLVLSTFNLPIGPEAGILGVSGAIEVYYLQVDGGQYLFVYSHLNSSTVALALNSAMASGGQVAGEPTTIGPTGASDGKHVHFQIIDADKLMEETGEGNPVTAFLSLVSLNATPVPGSSPQIIMQRVTVDPEGFIRLPLGR
ncbi:hypothetical protein HYU89_00065 [Candidatus Collierbacteria bacterium]|nr:hypothetical protein [Candidatus Collierbacteria bacterium]